MPDKSNEETLESDIELVTSPAASPLTTRTEEKSFVEKKSQPSHRLFCTLAIAYCICSDHSLDFGASLFRHGGITFFCQFLLAIILIAAPLLLLEVSLGQFSSTAVYFQLRRAVPLFSGLAASMAFLLCLRGITQTVWLTHVGALTVHSLKGIGASGNPWDSCEGLPSSCFDPRTFQVCQANSSLANDELCLRQFSALVESRTTNERTTPFLSFVETNMLRNPQLASEFQLPDHYTWISLLVISLSVFPAVYWHEKWLKYATPVVCGLCSIYYLVHLAMSFTLENSFAGLSHLFQPKWTVIYNPEAWTEAVAHAVFALNLANGGMAYLSSGRTFNSSIRRDVVIVTSCVVFFYVLANLTTFLYAGHLASVVFSDIPSAHRVKLLLEKRLHFMHFVYIETISIYEAGWLWCLFHFLVEFIRSYLLMMIQLATLIGMAHDRQVVLFGPDSLTKRFKWIVLAVITAASTVVNFHFIAPGGFRQLMIVESFADILTMAVAFLEVIVFVIVYGVRRLAVNLETMSESWMFMKHYLCVSWALLSPTALLTCLLMSIISAVIAPKPLSGILSFTGWTLVMTGISFTLVFATTKIIFGIRKGDSWKTMTRPTADWGPLLDEDRKIVVKNERAVRVR